MIEKNCFIDLETTGTNSEIHAIHQIAGIIEIAGNRVEHFDIKVNPGVRRIEKEALEIAGVTEEIIKEYPPAEEGYNALKKILNGYVKQYDNPKKITCLFEPISNKGNLKIFIFKSEQISSFALCYLIHNKIFK